MRALIIEDEINAYEYLVSIIEAVNDQVTIVDHIDSVEDAINWFHSNEEVDVIFMDIQLSDGLSFEIFNHVEVLAPIIFTTAYDEYAIRAFKLNSIDYLLKPIGKEELKHAFDKLEKPDLQMGRQNGQVENISNGSIAELLRGLRRDKRNRFLVKKGNHYEFLNANYISFFHSEDSLTFIYSPDGRRHIYPKTIADLEGELDTTTFFQINRKQIVNINAVKKIHPYLNQRLKLELTNDADKDFVVSRNRATEFKHWVDG